MHPNPVSTVETPASCPSGTKKFCSIDVGNARQPLATSGPQAALRLAFGVHRAPLDAPQRIVAACDTAAQALAVSIAAGNHKLDYIAACIGKSRGYISRMQSGKRPIPNRLIAPLCAATGSNLLRQFVTLHAAMEEINETQRLAELLRRVA